MTKVLISGYKPGFKKVSHTKLLRSYAGLSLKPAKDYTDRVLSGETVVVELPTPEAAEEFARESRDLGAITEVEHQASRAR